MSIRALLRITLLCVFFLMPTACGWIFANGPPPNHERLNFFTCSQSRAAPAIDAIWTVLMAAIVVSTLASSEAQVRSDFNTSKGAVVAVYGTWGAATGLSAASGFKKVNQCRDATALLMERLSRAADTPSATPRLEALAWRPPQLFPVRSSLKEEASAGY